MDDHPRSFAGCRRTGPQAEVASPRSAPHPTPIPLPYPPHPTLQNKPVEAFRNTFANLALPLFAMAEPIPPKVRQAGTASSAMATAMTDLSHGDSAGPAG